MARAASSGQMGDLGQAERGPVLVRRDNERDSWELGDKATPGKTRWPEISIIAYPDNDLNP